MSDATVKLGWDNSAAKQGAAEAVSIAQRAALSEAKRGAAYERGFGGLDDFYADQRDPGFARAKTPMLDAAFGRRSPIISTAKAERSGSIATRDDGKGLLTDIKEVLVSVDRNIGTIAVA